MNPCLFQGIGLFREFFFKNLGAHWAFGPMICSPLVMRFLLNLQELQIVIFLKNRQPNHLTCERSSITGWRNAWQEDRLSSGGAYLQPERRARPSGVCFQWQNGHADEQCHGAAEDLDQKQQLRDWGQDQKDIWSYEGRGRSCLSVCQAVLDSSGDLSHGHAWEERERFGYIPGG